MMQKTKAISAQLLDWYDLNKRDLPWRATEGNPPSPYHVWLSEIMLQQTVVKTVIPYFETFIKRWPRIADLAAAPLDDVLAAWAGLGYYARARNLHRCANVIVKDHGGKFPASEAALLRLPGIGAYTAAAIAAIAFDQRAAVVDGNVERVFSRLFNIQTLLPAAKPLIKSAVCETLPDSRYGDFAQATMELGALICRPKAPKCELCPVSKHCKAYMRGTSADLPRKRRKANLPQRWGIAAMITDAGQQSFLLETRPQKGLLGGMKGVPLFIETAQPKPEKLNEKVKEFLSRHHGLNVENISVSEQTVSHVFTHFRLEVRIASASLLTQLPKQTGLFWQDKSDADLNQFPSLMRKIIKTGAAL